MLPPVLEIYVLWHPSDTEGRAIAMAAVEHFHGTPFTGLIGGAVEVLVRSEGWKEGGGSPRPLPMPATPLPNGLGQAQYVAVVPIFGNHLADAVERGVGGWKDYIISIREAQRADPQRVGIFPYRLDPQSTNGTALAEILGGYQAIAAGQCDTNGDTEDAMRWRDLAQALTQFLSGDVRLTAFISHTKRRGHKESADVETLISLVREVIARTHLRDFFDASDIQPGSDWEQELRTKASTSALLALRTDLYPSREWCQREVLLAKQHGMPVMMLDAMGFREERGSFLMDHVPRIAIRTDGGAWSRRDVYRSLDLLVDECLKRALWNCQMKLAKEQPHLAVSWWAPHAPEPVTLVHWLQSSEGSTNAKAADQKLRILHPDPPLGSDERAVLQQILTLAGVSGALDVMTPRQLAARGG